LKLGTGWTGGASWDVAAGTDETCCRSDASLLQLLLLMMRRRRLRLLLQRRLQLGSLHGQLYLEGWFADRWQPLQLCISAAAASAVLPRQVTVRSCTCTMQDNKKCQDAKMLHHDIWLMIRYS